MTLHCIKSHYTILHNITHIHTSYHNIMPSDVSEAPRLLKIFHLGMKGGNIYPRLVGLLNLFAALLTIFTAGTFEPKTITAALDTGTSLICIPAGRRWLFFGWKVGKRVSNRAGWLDFGSNKNHSPWMLFGGMIFYLEGNSRMKFQGDIVKLYEII